MAPHRRCTRPRPPLHDSYGYPSSDPIDYLGPDGPLHPDLPPIRTVDDACEALDLSRPESFRSGLLVLLLDEVSQPYLAIAVDNAPDDDLNQIAGLLTGALRLGHPIAGVLLGVYRTERSVGSMTVKMTVDGGQLAAWMSLSRLLQPLGITLVDVLVFEPGRWMSLVAATSSDVYPNGALPNTESLFG